MAEPSQWQLERYRPLLHLQVLQMQLDPRLRRRFDASDLVQEALLKAHQQRDRFRGTTEAELVKWLHEILASTAIDEVRKATAQKRDAGLEQSLHLVLTESSARLDAYLAAKEPSPSQQAERHELLLRIAAAIGELPEDQRAVVVLRDLLATPVTQIAAQLGRTEKSVAGLLLRGRRQLRERLVDLR